jgi:hypothetical protein
MTPQGAKLLAIIVLIGSLATIIWKWWAKAQFIPAVVGVVLISAVALMLAGFQPVLSALISAFVAIDVMLQIRSSNPGGIFSYLANWLAPPNPKSGLSTANKNWLNNNWFNLKSIGL